MTNSENPDVMPHTRRHKHVQDQKKGSLREIACAQNPLLLETSDHSKPMVLSPYVRNDVDLVPLPTLACDDGKLPC